MSVSIFIIIAVCGLLIGVLSGAFGIGGGTMMVPLLNLVFRIPILTAAPTSLFVIAPTALSGTLRHMRQKTVDIRVGAIIGLAGAASSSLGALAADRLPELFTIMLAAAVIIFSAVTTFSQALKAPKVGKSAPAPAIHRSLTGSVRLLACVGIGLFAGLIAGIVGVGGGFIIVPFGIAWLNHSMKEMSGTSLLAVAIIALPGILAHALLGHIAYLYGLALIIGSMPGAVLGAWLITKLPERVLRLAFGTLLVFSGIMMVVNHALVS